jgi:hypothetical protein
MGLQVDTWHTQAFGPFFCWGPSDKTAADVDVVSLRVCESVSL